MAWTADRSKEPQRKKRGQVGGTEGERGGAVRDSEHREEGEPRIGKRTSG